MKKIIYLILIFTVGILYNSCKDELLEKTPKDQVSDPDFWQSQGDLELYLNGLYDILPGWNTDGSAPSADLGTDIVVEAPRWWGGSYTKVLDGTVNVPASSAQFKVNTDWPPIASIPTYLGGWDWRYIRMVNYFLENATRVKTGSMVDHYIGEAHFFRAWFYFFLLRDFGELPIITKVVGPDDEDLLNGPRKSRSEVADFIISDLDIAISKMKIGSQAGVSRLNKDIASLFKARVCLYEGTWEKYHKGTVFEGKTDGSAYLAKAATAAKSVMDGGNYSIVTGNVDNAYYNLFVQTDYRQNKEVLLYKHYNAFTHGQGNSLWNWPSTQGATREMTKNYLCTDGLPIAVSPLFKGDSLFSVLQVNRDPRLNQSLIVPGELNYVALNGSQVLFTLPFMDDCPTGYELEKWRIKTLDPLRTNQRTWDIGYIIFRYAEALLIYAEAKAELNQLTQADVDLTINKLRARVGMPNLVISSIRTDPNWPKYGYTLPDYLYEIRRERVVELFGEGFRFDDLMRWRAHNIFVGKRPTGVAYSDIKSKYPNVVVNAQGFVDPFKTYLRTGAYGFKPEKDYLRPLPLDELTLNKNLKQNPGW
jgi:hypothetical protein